MNNMPHSLQKIGKELKKMKTLKANTIKTQRCQSGSQSQSCRWSSFDATKYHLLT